MVIIVHHNNTTNNNNNNTQRHTMDSIQKMVGPGWKLLENPPPGAVRLGDLSMKVPHPSGKGTLVCIAVEGSPLLEKWRSTSHGPEEVKTVEDPERVKAQRAVFVADVRKKLPPDWRIIEDPTEGCVRPSDNVIEYSYPMGGGKLLCVGGGKNRCGVRVAL